MIAHRAAATLGLPARKDPMPHRLLPILSMFALVAACTVGDQGGVADAGLPDTGEAASARTRGS